MTGTTRRPDMCELDALLAALHSVPRFPGPLNQREHAAPQVWLLPVTGRKTGKHLVGAEMRRRLGGACRQGGTKKHSEGLGLNPPAEMAEHPWPGSSFASTLYS